MKRWNGCDFKMYFLSETTDIKKHMCVCVLLFFEIQMFSSSQVFLKVFNFMLMKKPFIICSPNISIFQLRYLVMARDQSLRKSEWKSRSSKNQLYQKAHLLGLSIIILKAYHHLGMNCLYTSTTDYHFIIRLLYGDSRSINRLLQVFMCLFIGVFPKIWVPPNHPF